MCSIFIEGLSFVLTSVGVDGGNLFNYQLGKENGIDYHIKCGV